MKIAIDLDGVLGDVARSFLNWYNQEHKTKWTFEDMVDCSFATSMSITPEEERQAVRSFWKSDGFKQMSVIEGASTAIEKLIKQHELYVVTARSEEIGEVTRAWINKYFPDKFAKIVLTNQYMMHDSGQEKGDICRELGCEILIDDSTINMESGWKNNLKLIIFDRPWNSYHKLPDSVVRVKNWDEVIKAVELLNAKVNV